MSNQESIERRMLRKLAGILENRMDNDPDAMTAAELTLIRQLSTDAGISLSDIEAGDFGEVSSNAAKLLREKQEEGDEDLPFDVENMPRAR